MLSLASKSVGSPDNSYQWYLHSSGAAIATGLQIALGDGSATGLWIGETTIGVVGAAGKTTIATLSTGTRAVVMADAAGTLWPALDDSAAETANSTTTAATVANFSVTLEASALYEFELILIFKSAAVATSPRWTLNGPTAQTEFVYYEVTGPGATNTQYTAWGTAGANAVNAPGINTPYAVYIRGVCKTTATTPASAVTLDIFSEVGASAITLLGGSPMRFRKIN